MKIEILDDAKDDLLVGYRFYENQKVGLGDYFLDSMYGDIDSLRVFAGIHEKSLGFHRLLGKTFPFAVYYKVADQSVYVHAVLDCRQNPSWTRRRLSS